MKLFTAISMLEVGSEVDCLLSRPGADWETERDSGLVWPAGNGAPQPCPPQQCSVLQS